MGPKIGHLKTVEVIERLPNENDDDYLVRAFNMVQSSGVLGIISTFGHCFDVYPTKTFEYLRGFVDGYKNCIESGMGDF